MSTRDKWLCAGAVLTSAAILTLGWVTGLVGSHPDPAVPSNPVPAASWVQPYGGCDEAWQAPDSPGAQDCRDHGYPVASTEPLHIVKVRGFEDKSYRVRWSNGVVLGYPARADAIAECRDRTSRVEEAGCLGVRRTEYHWLAETDKVL